MGYEIAILTLFAWMTWPAVLGLAMGWEDDTVIALTAAWMIPGILTFVAIVL